MIFLEHLSLAGSNLFSNLLWVHVITDHAGCVFQLYITLCHPGDSTCMNLVCLALQWTMLTTEHITGSLCLCLQQQVKRNLPAGILSFMTSVLHRDSYENVYSKTVDEMTILHSIPALISRVK